jgi:hypothetical protein
VPTAQILIIRIFVFLLSVVLRAVSSRFRVFVDHRGRILTLYISLFHEPHIQHSPCFQNAKPSHIHTDTVVPVHWRVYFTKHLFAGQTCRVLTLTREPKAQRKAFPWPPQSQIARKRNAKTRRRKESGHGFAASGASGCRPCPECRLRCSRPAPRFPSG